MGETYVVSGHAMFIAQAEAGAEPAERPQPRQILVAEDDLR
jgi:hypothetical protein